MVHVGYTFDAERSDKLLTFCLQGMLVVMKDVGHVAKPCLLTPEWDTPISHVRCGILLNLADLCHM